jgi:transcriptional regulator with XRE-family HTH domain
MGERLEKFFTPTSGMIRRAVGQTIRDLRKQLGIAQETLAADSGVDRSYVGQIERGEHTPTLDMLHRLLPTLRVTFSEFAVGYERRLYRAARKNNGP